MSMLHHPTGSPKNRERKGDEHVALKGNLLLMETFRYNCTRSFHKLATLLPSDDARCENKYDLRLVAGSSEK
jgi:hypothetical protein